MYQEGLPPLPQPSRFQSVKQRFMSGLSQLPGISYFLPAQERSRMNTQEQIPMEEQEFEEEEMPLEEQDNWSGEEEEEEEEEPYQGNYSSSGSGYEPEAEQYFSNRL
jgi:hypothetical protein